MKNIMKRLLVCLLVAAMTLAICSVMAEEAVKTDDKATEPATEEVEIEDVVYKTEAEALAAMEKIAETDSLELWFNETQIHFAVKVKATGYIWWSEPFNADLDAAAKIAQIRDLKSTFIFSNNLDSTTISSYLQCVSKNDNGDKVICDKIDNGVKVTFKLPNMMGFIIPMEFKLEDDHFVATILGEQIKENKKDNEQKPYQLTSISLLPNFGAANTQDTGYMVVPDGAGAVINYNNGKSTYAEYSAPVYGRDITDTLTMKESEREQVYMPAIGLVKNGNALLAVCTEGDERANVNAYGAGQRTTSYNNAYFSFTLRAKDTYYIAGDLQQPLDMYESVDTKFTNYSVSYYPIAAKDADYNDIAARYRKYLTEDEKIEKKTEANDETVYLTVYGGTYKETSILGIPAKVKTAATTYEQAEKILTELLDEGVKDIVVNYIDWNNDAISRKICTDVNPAGSLGGKSDFKKLKEFADKNGIKIYYDMEISEFGKSGNGFNTLLNATACLTKSYSRQTDYDLSWDIEAEDADKWSLLVPSSFGKVFDKITEDFTKEGIKNISLGSVSKTLYSDFGKNGTDRFEMAKIIKDGYNKLSGEVGSVLANTANQYIWSEVDCITNLPLYSSHYDIFDYDVPFLQLCLHGLVPYSTEAINASADSDELYSLAIATASNLGYDFLYEENKSLQNTSYNKYYYANFDGWSQTVGGQYKMVSDIVAPLSAETIEEYKIDGDVITSTFSNGTVIEVNKETNTIKVNGTEINYADYNL